MNATHTAPRTQSGRPRLARTPGLLLLGLLLGPAPLTAQTLAVDLPSAPAGGQATAVIRFEGPGDVAAFSLELAFSSGQVLALAGTGAGEGADWFSRGAYFPVSPFGPAPTQPLNRIINADGRTRVYLDSFDPTGTSGNVGSLAFNVSPSAADGDSQVLSLSGRYWSQSEQREVAFATQALTFTVGTAQDGDNDGAPDASDNCPTVPNADQSNQDGDSQGDACDTCPLDANNDIDSDTICGNLDNCPLIANTTQDNNDGDALGDACDPDDDNDGQPDSTDNCPLTSNPGQENHDTDSNGDACDPDDDNDGVLDASDNCPLTANPGQEDQDRDRIGDACDDSTDDFCWQCLPSGGGWRAIYDIR